MNKMSKIISYILVVLMLVCGIAVICKYGNSSDASSSNENSVDVNLPSATISKEDFCSLGFSARTDILPNSYLRYGVKISESYYKSLLEKDSDTEIGILFVSERYLGNGKILECSTEGAKKEVLNDSLATQTADETGYFSAFVTSPLITDLNETYYGVGYVKSGENISYAEGRSTNVVWLFEQEYLNENSTVDKSLLLPYLSENFKKEHGLLEESVTLNLGGELSNAAGMSLLECYSDSVLYIGDELLYNDESATITEYAPDLGYYTFHVVTGEFYKSRNAVITVTVNRGEKYVT